MLILTNECVGNIPNYSEYNITNLNSGNVYAINAYLMDEIINAANTNVTEITINVPQFSSNPEKNWPLSENVGQAISNVLYSYKIISNKVNVKICSDQNINKKYDIMVEVSAD